MFLYGTTGVDVKIVRYQVRFRGPESFLKEERGSMYDPFASGGSATAAT